MIELKREIGEKEFQSKERVTSLEEQLESQSKQAEDAIDEFKAEVIKCSAHLMKDIFQLLY